MSLHQPFTLAMVVTEILLSYLSVTEFMTTTEAIYSLICQLMLSAGYCCFLARLEVMTFFFSSLNKRKHCPGKNYCAFPLENNNNDLRLEVKTASPLFFFFFKKRICLCQTVVQILQSSCDKTVHIHQT